MNLGFVLFGTFEQDVPVISKEVILLGEFGRVSPSSTIRDVDAELSRSHPLATILIMKLSGT